MLGSKGESRKMSQEAIYHSNPGQRWWQMWKWRSVGGSGIYFGDKTNRTRRWIRCGVREGRIEGDCKGFGGPLGGPALMENIGRAGQGFRRPLDTPVKMWSRWLGVCLS